MGFRDVLAKMKEKKEAEKEQFNQMKKQKQWEGKLSEMEKSSNERELERLMNEEREKGIKEKLDYMRARRDEDIKFKHNPVDVHNITNSAKWNVLSERNQFSNSRNLFTNNEFIHKNNKNLFSNNQNLTKQNGDILKNGSRLV